MSSSTAASFCYGPQANGDDVGQRDDRGPVRTAPLFGWPAARAPRRARRNRSLRSRAGSRLFLSGKAGSLDLACSQRAMTDAGILVDDVAPDRGVAVRTAYRWIAACRSRAHRMDHLCLWKFKIDEWVRRNDAADSDRTDKGRRR